MVAPTLIAAAYNMPGTPERWKELPPDLRRAAGRVPRRRRRRRSTSPSAPRSRSSPAEPLIERAALHAASATEIEMLWRVREGMQGLLAAMRPPGRAR